MTEIPKKNERPMMIAVLAIIAAACGALTLFSGGQNHWLCAVV